HGAVRAAPRGRLAQEGRCGAGGVTTPMEDQQDGVHALVEKYLFESHSRKAAASRAILSEPQRMTLKRICESCKVQPPDLLIFTPDRRRFRFAEVKGPGDRLSPQQLRSHRAIMNQLGVPIELVAVRVL
ncbi:MAG: VRR-NUC domain-containing protein, partial [Burkholderiales bacterium]